MNYILALLMIGLLSLSDSSWYKSDRGSYWPSRKPKPKKPECDFGVIQPFFGNLDDIPNGFQLCDGSNETPDLRDTFLVGAGDVFAFGDTGGDFEVGLDVENLPSHNHGSGSLATDDSGDHTHDFATDTDQGSHVHNVIDLEIAPNGLHLHEVKLETDKDGDHKHKFDAYDPETYDTQTADFDVPIQKIDLDKSYPIEVSEDPGHKHNFDGPTEQEGEHSHDVDGTVGDDDKDGEHQHSVVGTTDNAGIHIHEINGDTAEVGEGKPFPILPPFNAVYWICCARKEKPKPKWYSSSDSYDSS